MKSLNMRKGALFLVITAILAGTMPGNILAQNCGCAANECCSRWGFCGNDQDYCGAGSGCQQGPCITNDVSVLDVVTQEFFDGILGQADANCVGKNFYTRDAFRQALSAYSKFSKSGTADDAKREIAAFFAHVTHETDHFCYIEEKDGASQDYCDETKTQYPCNPNKGYYGRGALQLTWNYNYGPAGSSIGFDGLNSPETVAKDPVIAFKAALWYWLTNVEQVTGKGFGPTIRAINGDRECDGKNPGSVNDRIKYYKQYCNQFGVSPGDNLSC
ncbi:hypothetical protein SLE2022_220690 [Rubroshorea leprosula]